MSQMPPGAQSDLVRRPAQGRAAFTLFELVVVIAIMAIMAAIAIPRYANSIAMRRVELAAGRIVEDMALARRYALATSASCTVTFVGGSERVRVSGVKPLDPGQSEYITELSQRPYEVNLRDIDFGGDNAVTFDGFGAPDSGGSVRVLLGTLSRTVLLDPESGVAEVAQ